MEAFHQEETTFLASTCCKQIAYFANTWITWACNDYHYFSPKNRRDPLYRVLVPIHLLTGYEGAIKRVPTDYFTAFKAVLTSWPKAAWSFTAISARILRSTSML